MKDKILLEVVENRPENLLLARTEELLALEKRGRLSHDLRRTVLAELVVRWCLSRDCVLEEELASSLAPTWRPFADWYRTVRPWTGRRSLPDDIGVWPEKMDLPGFVAVLRRRLARLFAADGFIPLCRGSEAWFVPFQLAMDVQGAVWNDGEEIAVWRSPVCRSLLRTGYTGIKIQLRNGPEVAAGVKGNSLMLPVRMAALRGKPGGLPAYDVFQVLATGEFDDGFHLADVELLPKFEAMKAQRLDAFMIGPDVPGAISAGERGFCRLDSGIDEDGVLSVMRDFLERTDGCVHMSRDYVLRRLPDMVKHVDRENHRRWNDVAMQLERLKDAVMNWRDSEEWLEFSSLLATALCHAGRTEDSQKCTDEAMAFAREHGYEAMALRLEVTAAVNAQDLGEVDEYRVLACGLEEKLASFDGDEKNDLLMRYHGTAAQANAWGALYGMDGFSVEAAKGHADAAVNIALGIAKSVPPDKRDEAESNLAQDLNYRHLVLALFNPGTEEEKSAFKDAQRQLNELSERSAKTNRYHQMRQKSLALFNAWRMRREVCADIDLADWRLPSDAEGWQIAANRTHIGVLAVVAGDVDEARRCFREGDEALPLARCWAPVIASIRLVLLLHAACSLKEKDAEAAAEYLQKAEAVEAKFGESKLFGVMRADRWMSTARSGSDSRSLPQFYY